MSSSRHIRVMSFSPGRTRLKVPHRYRTQEEMQRIATALGARPDVSDVQANIHTGSLLVFHDQGQGGLEGLRITLEEMGFALREVTQAEAPTSNGERPEAAANLLGAVGGLNERVGRMTGGKFDLRLLVPLSLGALSARQIARKGLELDEIPWYVLAWDAFQSFSTLHSKMEQQKSDGLAAVPSDVQAGS